MNKSNIQETTEILKRLSPQNQAYFMTLVRVAEAAENGIKMMIQNTPTPPTNKAG